jgi:hypothetical protein
MTKLLQAFRMDRAPLSIVSTSTPTSDQQAALIQRAKDFVSAIQASLLQETKDWATEFQSTAAHMEKDLKSQIDTLKVQLDKVAKEREDASRVGAIELTVTNADKIDGFRFDIVLETKTRPVLRLGIEFEGLDQHQQDPRSMQGDHRCKRPSFNFNHPGRQTWRDRQAFSHASDRVIRKLHLHRAARSCSCCPTRRPVASGRFAYCLG